MVLSDRFFFVTCHVFRKRSMLAAPEFACLANVFCSRRDELGFLITAWVFLPNHWHAIVFPRPPVTISTVMKSIKVSAAARVNEMNGGKVPVWQGRFFDRALRTVKAYRETIEYIHWNPVKAGLAKRPENWAWSSAREYASTPNASGSILPIDMVELPMDERARI
jgi:putative transposase